MSDGDLTSEREQSPPQEDRSGDEVKQARGEPASGSGQALPQAPQPGRQPERASTATLARRGLAFALLAGWLAMLMVSAWTAHLQVCNDEVARVGGTALVRSCGSLSITDAPSLALLVIFGVLLLPDLSALEIPGILRVERKLEEQARRQDDFTAMIQRLEVSIAQRVEVNTYYFERRVSDAVKAGELIALQDEKIKEFNAPTTRSQSALWQ
jgi:hypothetical protein